MAKNYTGTNRPSYAFRISVKNNLVLHSGSAKIRKGQFLAKWAKGGEMGNFWAKWA